MKILLQNKHTLQYLRTVDTWTKNHSEAHNFLHSQKAIEFAHQHGLMDVYVTVKFQGGEADVAVPLPDQALHAIPRARM
jgi:lipid II:glycine glycyltransferase (peptidoglycan interpeptide bridge formation enzyme)